MRNINILIKQNVDVKKGIEISKSIELYEKLIDQFLENIGNIKYQINNALLENKLNEYAKLVENLKIQAKNI